MKTTLNTIFLFFLLTNLAIGETFFSSLLNSDDARYQNITVEQVLTTDMIRIIVDGGQERIKLIGLKGPEAPKRKRLERDKNGLIIQEIPTPETPINEKAFFYVKELLEGKTVRLEFDTQLRDPQGYKLAYVFLQENDLFTGAILR
ncbi:MAG: hypothetical protein EOM53_05900, partial [Alphaproteobacteria bacterium]|nr:hypothetical protein [Alphaproteobacteria bacterium]